MTARIRLSSMGTGADGALIEGSAIEDGPAPETWETGCAGWRRGILDCFGAVSDDLGGGELGSLFEEGFGGLSMGVLK